MSHIIIKRITKTYFRDLESISDEFCKKINSFRRELAKIYENDARKINFSISRTGAKNLFFNLKGLSSFKITPYVLYALQHRISFDLQIL